MKVVFAAASISILLMVSGARAQFSENVPFGAGVIVGASKLQGDIENTNLGFTGGLLFSYSPGSRLKLVTTGTFGKMTSGLDAIKTDVVGIDLTGSLYLVSRGMLRPFVSAGLSYFHYNAKDSDGNTFVRADSTEIASWEPGLQMGLGLEVLAARPWALTTSISYTFTPSDDLDAISSGKNDGFFRFMVGLVRYFDFGGKTRVTKSAPAGGKQATTNAVTQTDTDKDEESVAATADEQEAYGDGIYFEPGSADLPEATKKQLDKLYTYLINHTDEKIQLLKPEKGNKHSKLVIKRAHAIKRYLVELGISPDRILIQ